MTSGDLESRSRSPICKLDLYLVVRNLHTEFEGPRLNTSDIDLCDIKNRSRLPMSELILALVLMNGHTEFEDTSLIISAYIEQKH